MLFAAAERTIRDAGFHEVTAGVTTSAVGFYEAMGMRAIGRKSSVAPVLAGTEVVLMAKGLSPRPAGDRAGGRTS